MATQNTADLIPAVGYIRMSTDMQVDSPERQRAEIIRLAARTGHHIAKWYEDHGKTGTESRTRKEFQRMLADAKAGKFKAVLLYELSRLSREDFFAAVDHWRVFRDAGVRLVTCISGEIDFDNLPGLMMALVGQHTAHSEVRTMAARISSGIRRYVEAGNRGGGTLFGYDREIRDDAGNLVRLVPYTERFKRPNNWTTKLVPSQVPGVTAAIRWAFKHFASGGSMNAIVREFKNRGIVGTNGKPLVLTNISQMLRNPVYCGTLRVGGGTKAKFAPVFTDGVQLIPNAIAGIVSVETFQQVARRIKDKTPLSRAEPGAYLLSSLVVCGNCGQKAYGVRRKKRHGDRAFERFYECQNRPDCGTCRVHRELLEGSVLTAIRDELGKPDAVESIRAALRRASGHNDDVLAAERETLNALRKKLERTEENLALADGESDFRAVKRVHDRLLAEVAESELRVSAASETVTETPEVMEAIEKFAALQTRLHKNRKGAALLLRKMVDRVIVTTGEGWNGQKVKPERTAEIVFSGSLGIEPLIVRNSELSGRPSWRDAAEFIRASERPVQLREVAERFGWGAGSGDSSLARYHVGRAANAGLVRKITGGSYVSSEEKVAQKA